MNTDDVRILSQLFRHRLQHTDVRLALERLTSSERANLTERLTDVLVRTSTLLDVSRRLSSELAIDPLLVQLTDLFAEFLDAERSTIFLADPRTGELYSRATQDSAMREVRFPSDRGIAGAVFSSREPLLVPDAYADSRFNVEVDRKTGFRTRSILSMPVVNKEGRRIAVMQVLNKRGGPFDALDVERLRSFSSLVSIALDNARLFDEIVRVKNYNESVLESMTGAVLTLDDRGTIAKVNAAGLRLFRAQDRPDAIVGKRAEEYFGSTNPWILDAIRFVLDTGSPDMALDAELTIRPPDDLLLEGVDAPGKASVNLTAVPLSDAEDAKIGCLLMFEDISREKRLEGTMARYVPKEIADRLFEEGEGALGGKLLKASILFTDIRDFTATSERIGPQATVRLLNDYFEVMVEFVLDKGGLLDKYIGDAMLAVFGVPFPGGDDADHAVEAAIEMTRALREFNSGRDEKIAMGIGINTDHVPRSSLCPRGRRRAPRRG